MLKNKLSLVLSVALICAGGVMAGEPEHGNRAPAHPAEPHQGPHGYQRVTEPKGWNARPATVDRATYQHNFQAARSYRIGPYHRPSGWAAHRWGYGEILPRAYWGPQYISVIIGCSHSKCPLPATSGCATTPTRC